MEAQPAWLVIESRPMTPKRSWLMSGLPTQSPVWGVKEAADQ